MTMQSRAASPRAASGRTGGAMSLAPRRAAATRGRAGMLADACWRFVRRRPGAVACAAVTLALTSAFGWNATHQLNRHRAPLFGTKSAASAPDARKAEPAAAPLPVPRPEALSTVAPAIPDPAPKSSRPDPIGAMIRSADAGAKPDDAKPDPARVSSAQKTLIKLGYGPLKSDGVMGATTRQALERFEKDRNLPVTGSLAGRTARQLAAQSSD